jgi:heme A synthase
VATTDSTSTPPATPARTRSPLYASVIGLAGLGILLQAVWAGMFIREGQDFRDNWVTVHSIGATVVDVLALIAVVVAFVQLRARRDVVIGTIVFLVLLVLEGVVGGFIGDTPGLEVIHFPLALLLMALTAWLSLRAGRRA